MSVSTYSDKDGVSYDEVCALCHLRRGSHWDGRCYQQIYADKNRDGVGFGGPGAVTFVRSANPVMRTRVGEEEIILALGLGTYPVSALAPAPTEIYSNLSTVSKYAGRECPCGMHSSVCEYHR